MSNGFAVSAENYLLLLPLGVDLCRLPTKLGNLRVPRYRNSINLNPNDMSSTYTALSFAQKLCDQHKIAAAPVTFDQPLYIKAVDVIAASPNELSSLFTRLGGFHWLMSATGSLGYLMTGSGLDDLFKIDTPGTVPHIMSGHAYSRAFWAHLLASSALLSSPMKLITWPLIFYTESLILLMSAKVTTCCQWQMP